MPAKVNAPIILKRKKVIAAGGHHGGAWKVAYADFVTAMMAFFLLMWLLGATNEKQRKGIADYFNPSIPINKVSGGGEGAFGGESVFAEAAQAQNGIGSEMVRAADANRSKGATGVDHQGDEKAEDPPQSELFDDLEKKLVGSGGESMVSDRLRRHIVTRVTDEGLIVEVYDLPNAPMFTEDDRPEDRLIEVTGLVADVFRLAENPIAIRGHVATTPLAARNDPVWSRSLIRAGAARALIEATGLRAARIRRVEGHADRATVHANPLSIRNNRIEFVLLRQKE